MSNLNVEELVNFYLDCPGALESLGDIYEKAGRFCEANQVKQSVSLHSDLDSCSSTLLIVFASRNDDPRQIPFQFRKSLSQVDVKKMFIRDVHDAWYHKGLKNIVGSVEGVASYLKKQVEQTNPKKLITLGASSGGYAALLFGFLLNADKTIAFSPQTKLPRPEPFLDRKLLVGCDSRYFDLLELEWGKSKTTCDIHYSANFNSDRDAAIRMNKLNNFKLFSYQAGELHNIAKWLKTQGKLESILLEVR